MCGHPHTAHVPPAASAEISPNAVPLRRQWVSDPAAEAVLRVALDQYRHVGADRVVVEGVMRLEDDRHDLRRRDSREFPLEPIDDGGDFLVPCRRLHVCSSLRERWSMCGARATVARRRGGRRSPGVRIAGERRLTHGSAVRTRLQIQSIRLIGLPVRALAGVATGYRGLGHLVVTLPRYRRGDNGFAAARGPCAPG